MDGQEYLDIAESIYSHLVTASRNWPSGSSSDDFVVRSYPGAHAADGSAHSSDDDDNDEQMSGTGSSERGRRGGRRAVGNRHHDGSSDTDAGMAGGGKGSPHRRQADGSSGAGRVGDAGGRQRDGGHDAGAEPVSRARAHGGLRSRGHLDGDGGASARAGEDANDDGATSDEDYNGNHRGGAHGNEGGSGDRDGHTQSRRAPGGMSRQGSSGRLDTSDGGYARDGGAYDDSTGSGQRSRITGGQTGSDVVRRPRASTTGSDGVDLPTRTRDRRQKIDVGWKHHSRVYTYVFTTGAVVDLDMCRCCCPCHGQSLMKELCAVGREEEVHARHEANREYCERCPMIIKMIEDEEKLRIRLLDLEKEKLRLLYESQNWAAISRIEQGSFHHFLNSERNDDRLVRARMAVSFDTA